MITKSGTKLLDFGLAKQQAPRARPPAGPTLSAQATNEKPLTAEGSLLGTFQYMSPEQLEGREPDARSDVFALGLVLYEMVTGQRAFAGKSQASLIAAILTSEPTPASRIQPLTPPALDRVVAKCLAKDPDERWQSAQDLASELEWIAEFGSSTAALVDRRPWSQWLGWGLAAALAIAIAALAFRSPKTAPPIAPALTATLLPPPGIDYGFDVEQGPPALSPDGRQPGLRRRAARRHTEPLGARAVAPGRPGADRDPGGLLPFLVPG